VLSIFPIIDVASWTVFAVKILSVLVAATLLGVANFVMGRRRAALAVRESAGGEVLPNL
jgi:hypothetical protein